jgi:hypothetical protein
MIEEPRSPDEPGSSTRLVDKLKSSRYGECTHYDASNVVLELVSPRSCFDYSNLDHYVLPFDVAKGGEPAELFRIYPVRILRANFVLRI